MSRQDDAVMRFMIAQQKVTAHMLQRAIFLLKTQGGRRFFMKGAPQHVRYRDDVA